LLERLPRLLMNQQLGQQSNAGFLDVMWWQALQTVNCRGKYASHTSSQSSRQWSANCRTLGDKTRCYPPHTIISQRHQTKHWPQSSLTSAACKHDLPKYHEEGRVAPFYTNDVRPFLHAIFTTHLIKPCCCWFFFVILVSLKRLRRMIIITLWNMKHLLNAREIYFRQLIRDTGKLILNDY